MRERSGAVSTVWGRGSDEVLLNDGLGGTTGTSWWESGHNLRQQTTGIRGSGSGHGRQDAGCI